MTREHLTIRERLAIIDVEIKFIKKMLYVIAGVMLASAGVDNVSVLTGIIG